MKLLLLTALQKKNIFRNEFLWPQADPTIGSTRNSALHVLPHPWPHPPNEAIMTSTTADLAAFRKHMAGSYGLQPEGSCLRRRPFAYRTYELSNLRLHDIFPKGFVQLLHCGGPQGRSRFCSCHRASLSSFLLLRLLSLFENPYPHQAWTRSYMLRIDLPCSTSCIPHILFRRLPRLKQSISEFV